VPQLAAVDAPDQGQMRASGQGCTGDGCQG
jgi:hypothetical protein